MSDRRVDGRILAVLAGWVVARHFAITDDLYGAMGWQIFFAEALLAGCVGVLVLGWAVARRQTRLGRRQWAALLLLSAVSASGGLLWAPYVDRLLGLGSARGAQPMMALLMAPLWLALLGALRLVPEQTPRRTVGAALAGLAGYCLLLPSDQMSVRVAEWPVLLLVLMQAIGLVWTWSFARQALAGFPLAMVVGCAMVCVVLVNATLGWVARPLVDMQQPQAIAWPMVRKALPVAVLDRGVATICWYWLLERMELAAFSMQALLMMLSWMLIGLIPFGLLSWRSDVALVLMGGAVWVALRARPEDEEPVRLGVV